MKVYSIIESASHPKLSDLYQKSGYEEYVFTSMRKAIQSLKSIKPDLVVADFLYGYGNNYAGVNISNLDVFLYSMQKYAPQARVIALYEKSERPYIKQLQTLFPNVTCLELPLAGTAFSKLIQPPNR